MKKKYITLDNLRLFLTKLREIFAPIIHGHNIADISNLQNELNSKALRTDITKIQFITLEENDE